MSKLITKTFYVSDTVIYNLKNRGYATSYVLSNEKDKMFKNEIQISWQEPEKKIEITESKLDELKADWITSWCGTNYHDFLKQQLFGESDERNYP